MNPSSPAGLLSGGSATLALGRDCTIRGVTDLHRALLQLIDQSESVAIDAAAVERIDTAGLQLLFSFIDTLRRRSREVRIHGVTEPMRAAADRAGLSTALNLG